MNTSREFYRGLRQRFPFEPTLQQDAFFAQISDFLFRDSNYELFLLRGFAGTGKTSVISALVKELPKIRMKYVLLAPTGRAAKVISNYSGETAQTIHRKIYYPKKKGGVGVSFTLMTNKHTNTLFIVDEASMISDMQSSEKGLYENGSLLEDLMEYVYTGRNCKILFLGDTAQLPPVHASLSPALDPDRLDTEFGMRVQTIEFSEVMRQSEGSGILYNATQLRELLQDDFLTDFRFDLAGYQDIVRLQDGFEIQDAIYQAYDQKGTDETAFIVRSNKRANSYNQGIRARILNKESELSVGDLMMVVKNNYFWLEETDEAGFIANGDTVEILEIYKHYELYGFKFARVKVRMLDYPNQRPFETVLLLDTIHTESANLSYADSNRLYQEVLADYADERSIARRNQKVKANEFFNALQVKFAYAVTCHKSQGGQWDTVFVEQPYLPDGIDRDYVRWLYTAITRAKNKLYLIGFPDEFFV